MDASEKNFSDVKEIFNGGGKQQSWTDFLTVLFILIILLLIYLIYLLFEVEVFKGIWVDDNGVVFRITIDKYKNKVTIDNVTSKTKNAFDGYMLSGAIQLRELPQYSSQNDYMFVPVQGIVYDKILYWDNGIRWYSFN